MSETEEKNVCVQMMMNDVKNQKNVGDEEWESVLGSDEWKGGGSREIDDWIDRNESDLQGWMCDITMPVHPDLDWTNNVTWKITLDNIKRWKLIKCSWAYKDVNSKKQAWVFKFDDCSCNQYDATHNYKLTHRWKLQMKWPSNGMEFVV